ncbi:NUDIX hydrolase [Nocardioides sp. SR21]|uniref:NUDIX hydrolase n=1 Tax=Nocardioides sp. SR21 TaxID=2919501 RepID=UPI001FAA36D7|nr:NUDIX domain-containing protein [Nocardioides sp. SR21]
MSRPVRHRTTGRVLPVNGRGEVLLLHGWDPVRPEAPYWFSIGGAADHDESLAAAAAREMREETGLEISVDELSEPVGHELAEFDWGFWHLVQDQTYFAVRLDDTAGLHFDGLEPLERGTIDQAAWWTPDALDEDGSAANEQLTTMMRAAVRRILGEA